MSQGHKLNEIKKNINNVIANLQLLEGLSNAPLNDFDVEQSVQLERRTTTLLSELEEIPYKRIALIQKQRKRRRQSAKQREKLQKFINKATLKRSKPATVPFNTFTESASAARGSAQPQSQHIILKKLHDATNILDTFDLLQRLYEARGGEEDMAQKLAHMRTVWERVQQESVSANTLKASPNLETQWNKAIFGSQALVPMAQRRGHKKENTQDFLQKRIVWDSYINYGKNGSCIPSGWVLPPEEPTPEWAEYKVE